MPETGPHLAAAMLCEKVITEGDGVLSIIRVVDRVTHTATGEEPPAKMPPLLIDNLQMVIALKADQARGRFAIRLVMHAPDTTSKTVAEQDITLKPGNAGINIVAGMSMTLADEGVYWIDVLLVTVPGEAATQLLTRVPLEVVYQRQRVPAAPGPPDP